MRFLPCLAALSLLVAPIAVCAQTSDQAAPPSTPPPVSAVQPTPNQPAPTQTVPPPPPTEVAPPVQAAPPAAPLPSGEVNLRLRFVQGEVLTYKMNMAMTMAMNVPAGGQAGPMNMNTNVDMTMTQTVQQVDAAGNATILAQMENPTLTMNMNGQQFPAPANLGAQLNKGFIEVLSPDGKVLSVKSNDDSDHSASAMSGPLMSSMFNPGQMGSFTGFPDHPVKVGDIWRSTGVFGKLGMQMYAKMALIGLDSSSGSNIATIATKFHADMNPADTGAPGMQGTMDGKGHNIFDVDRGVLTSVQATMTMNGTVSTPSAASAAGNMKMNMTMNMTMTLVPTISS